MKKNLISDSNYTFKFLLKGEYNKQIVEYANLLVNFKIDNFFNPVIISGKHGSGKTHILRTIHSEYSNVGKSHYCTAEEFVAHFVRGIVNNEVDDFLKYYLSLDILLIDDLEYFINKEKSQGVIIQLIDGFIKEGKIIIFSTTVSDLNNIDLDEKLKLRLKAALLLRFKKANNQDFRNYVDIKLKLNNIDLKNIHKEELSSIEASNFHELNGHLLKLIFKKHIINQNQSYLNNSL